MTRRKLSPELAAMARIEAALEGLTPDVRKRVVGWAFDRWDPEHQEAPQPTEGRPMMFDGHQIGTWSDEWPHHALVPVTVPTTDRSDGG